MTPTSDTILLAGVVLASFVNSILNSWKIRDLSAKVNESLTQLLVVATKAAHAEGLIKGGDDARTLAIAVALAARDTEIEISVTNVTTATAERVAAGSAPEPPPPA